jgi:hypothetical protein
MKVLYKSPGGKFTVEFEGSTPKEIWKSLANFQEVYENHGEHCGQPTLFGYREVDGNGYYEKKCQKCGMKFSYGQHKSGGGLFPNSAKGWHKWTPVEDDEESATQVRQPTKKGK